MNTDKHLLAEAQAPEPVADGTSRPGLPLGLLFDEQPTAVIVGRESDGLIVAANRAWTALTGIDAEQAVGKTSVEVGVWVDEADRRQFLRQLGDEGALYTIRVAGGGKRQVRTRVVRLQYEGEAYLLVSVTDADREAAAEAARAETEAHLRQSNLRLQAQVELHQAIEKLARVGSWTNVRGSDTVAWSEGLYGVVGRYPDERQLDKRAARSGIHPDDLRAWTVAREALDGRELDFRWVMADGRQRWLRTRMSTTRVEGNPETDYGVVQDVTAEREAIQRLEQQLSLLQNVAARVPGLMYQARLQPDGRSSFTFVSEVVRDMLGVDPGALRQDAREIFRHLHPDDRPGVVESLRVATESMRIWRDTMRFNLPTGEQRWYSVEAVPNRESDGTVVWHGFTWDVTEARRAEQKLQQQHRMLEAVRVAQSLFISDEGNPQVFDTLLDNLLKASGSANGFIVEVHGGGADPAGDHGPPLGRLLAPGALAGRETGLEGTLVHRAIESGQPFVHNQTCACTGLEQIEGWPPSSPNLVLIPLVVEQQVRAVVGLCHHPEGYQLEDVDFLQPLLGVVRQLLVARQHHAERERAVHSLEVTSAALVERTAALQVTLDSMSQGLAKIERDGTVSFYNRRMLEMLDLPEDMMASRPSHAAVSAFMAARGDFGENFQLVEANGRDYVTLRGQASVPDRYLRRTLDGRVLEVGTRMLDDGAAVRTITDVTSYIAVQESLGAERQRLAWILEATRPGVWEVNLGTDELKVNDRWSEMLGYAPEELGLRYNRDWEHLAHPDDLVRANGLRDRHIAGELPYYECDLRLRHKDGRWVWVNARGRVHRRDEDQRALFMSGTHIDITDRVAAQEEVRALNASLEQRVEERTAALERSMRDMEAVSYSIAHDLRAPLRSVNGFAAVIAEEDEAALSPGARDMFGRIVKASRNMGQMLTDMLEVLRVVRVELQPVPVDMRALALEVAESLSPQLRNARIDIGPLPQAMGDAVLLRQVLSNLLDNALKYSTHQTEPVIQVGHDGIRNAYYVSDNGLGFDMAHAGKLFGMFQRLGNRSDVPGLGVGLAIVARIVERHNGRVWAESEAGQGATFWFRIPSPGPTAD